MRRRKAFARLPNGGAHTEQKRALPHGKVALGEPAAKARKKESPSGDRSSASLDSVGHVISKILARKRNGGPVTELRLPKVNVDRRSMRGATIVEAAAMSGSAAITKWAVLECGAKVDVPLCAGGGTPLLFAPLICDRDAAVRNAIAEHFAKNSSVTSKLDSGLSMLASLKALLCAGADANVSDANGMTALEAVAGRKSMAFEMACVLMGVLGNGAPIKKSDAVRLPQFANLLGIGNIFVPTTASALARAKAEIMAESAVGFDTETRPTFGRSVGGPQLPHVVQFGTSTRAWILRMAVPGVREMVGEIISSPSSPIKVGFDLANDVKHFPPMSRVVDLCHISRGTGNVGIVSVFGALFRRSFPKPKKMTLSNWAAPVLSTSQLLYAGRDAWGAMIVYEKLLADYPILNDCLPKVQTTSTSD